MDCAVEGVEPGVGVQGDDLGPDPPRRARAAGATTTATPEMTTTRRHPAELGRERPDVVWCHRLGHPGEHHGVEPGVGHGPEVVEKVARPDIGPGLVRARAHHGIGVEPCAAERGDDLVGLGLCVEGALAVDQDSANRLRHCANAPLASGAESGPAPPSRCEPRRALAARPSSLLETIQSIGDGAGPRRRPKPSSSPDPRAAPGVRPRPRRSRCRDRGRPGVSAVVAAPAASSSSWVMTSCIGTVRRGLGAIRASSKCSRASASCG